MYKVVLSNGKHVGYYFSKIPDEFELEEDYVIAIVSSNRTKYVNSLFEKKFVFADRSISIEIPIKKWKEIKFLSDSVTFKISTNWNAKELYQLVKKDFDKDCRFAVDISMKDTELKNELLYNFILFLKEQNAMITCCYIEDNLVGFNLWEVHKKKGRVFLGAVIDKYRGTGIAMYIYSYTIQKMKKMGGEILLDTVFTSNMRSMNLHILLAAKGEVRIKIKECEDWYKSKSV